jgi:probable F420-dependent oxidoreductase
MKTGILVNVNNSTAHPSDLARSAEDIGFESLWVGDHVTVPVKMAAEMPGAGGPLPESYSQISDPFVVLAMAAAVTRSLKVGIGACILPNRHPILTAKQAATLDWFSQGRLLFGVGAGWLQEQMEVMGADFPRRLGQTREYVAVMKALWRGPGDAASFTGRWINFQDMRLNPRPATPGGPRVLLGTWGPKAPKRVAEWADGWLPMLVDPVQLKAGVDQLRIECERRGRAPGEVEVSAFVYDAGASRERSRELLRRYEEAGAGRVVLIEGMGSRMGSKDWVAWSPATYREELEQVGERYL